MQGQVFDGGDTCEYKEHTFRQGLALNIINCLTNRDPQSLNLEISKYLQEWVIEEWTSDFDVKPTAQDLKTIGNFMTYAKKMYTKMSDPIKIISVSIL